MWRNKLTKCRFVVLSMILLIFFTGVVYAQEADVKVVIRSEHRENIEWEEIGKLLEEYALLKEEEFDITKAQELEAKLLLLSRRTSALVSNEKNRANAIKNNFFIVNNITLENVKSTFYICRIEAVENIDEVNESIVYNCESDKEYFRIEMREWTEIEYRCMGYSNTDEIKFETEHYMIIEKDKNKYYIVSDIYEESDINGFVSSEYEKEYVNIDKVAGDIYNILDILEKIDDCKILNGLQALNKLKAGNTRLAVTSGYDASIAIAYANRWTTNDGTSSSAGYNPYYRAYGDNDCCNFVSQCIYAGGIQETTGWKSARKNMSTGAFTGTTTTSWTSVTAFSNYWDDTYSLIQVTASNIKEVIYPGNPVYIVGRTDNSIYKHIGICVGYNSAGMPLINAHTNNRVNALASGWLSAATEGLYTIQFTTTSTYSDGTLEIPNSPIVLGNIGNNGYEYIGSLTQGNSEYFYFTVSASGYYDIYTTGNMGTCGYVYLVSNENLEPWYLDKLLLGDSDDGGSESQNFSMYNYYETGFTYCIRVDSQGFDTQYRLFIN